VKPDWFLDWSSAGAAIVAPGPSAKSADVAKLKGKVPVFAVKQGVDLCPWADAVYGCDAAWWRFRRGLPTFSGLKLRWSGNGCCDFSDVVGVTIRDNALDRIIVDEPGVIGSGRNSGFQALKYCGPVRCKAHPADRLRHARAAFLRPQQLGDVQQSGRVEFFQVAQSVCGRRR
jgi:hypothetical protein